MPPPHLSSDVSSASASTTHATYHTRVELHFTQHRAHGIMHPLRAHCSKVQPLTGMPRCYPWSGCALHSAVLKNDDMHEGEGGLGRGGGGRDSLSQSHPATHRGTPGMCRYRPLGVVMEGMGSSGIPRLPPPATHVHDTSTYVVRMLAFIIRLIHILPLSLTHVHVWK